jgi:alpha-glucosidase
MDRGADGFRLDVFNAYFKDEQFRDNPSKFGLRAFNRQKHLHDIDQPEMMPLLNDLRKLLDSYPDRYAVGETYFATPEKTVSYCGPDKLHAAFSFDFTSTSSEIAEALKMYAFDPDKILRSLLLREKVFNEAGVWPTTVMANHDVRRTASRYCRGEDDSLAKVAMALLLTLRGTPFLYYGEEIGMRELSLRRGEIMDPPGKIYWPLYPGRDGCRTPMQWDNSPYAGFSTTEPWLRVHKNYRHRNVAAQGRDPDSIYNFTKRLLALRKKTPALQRGSFVPLTAGPRGVLAYLRHTESQTVLVALNFTGRSTTLPVPEGMWNVLLSSTPDTGETRSDILLSPHQILILAKPQSLVTLP